MKEGNLHPIDKEPDKPLVSPAFTRQYFLSSFQYFRKQCMTR